MSASRHRDVLIMAALAGAVLAVYGNVYSHGFIEYDDTGYVRDNLIVRRGLTWHGVQWAFTTNTLGHWSPLTWLSHMLDIELFGLNPGAHHVVNVGFHLANTLLLFALFRHMTGDPWPSAVVAALFAIHPLHVESVAWIAERKDVLSTLFWLLTMWAYVRYSQTRSARWYAAMLICFALGLIAKPMLVTLPFVLLLMDWWPLGRVFQSPVPSPRSGTRSSNRKTNREPGTVDWRTARLLVAEKVPLLVLTVAASAIAYATQLTSGAMAETARLRVATRAANALVSYVKYLLMTAWPADLAVLYPYDVHLPTWQPIAAAGALIAVSVLVLRAAQRHAYLLVGWLWYLGTLVPVIGLVQIGSQALADRYTYVPLIGVFVMLAWGARAFSERWSVPPPATAAIAVLVIGAYALVARAQVGLWESGTKLLAHTVHVTRDNCIAHNNLGVSLAAQGDREGAMEHFREALRIKPDYSDAHDNLALALWNGGRRAEAVEHYRASLRAAPLVADTYGNLGALLLQLGQSEEAMTQIHKAIELDPNRPAAYVHLGTALSEQGLHDAARQQFERALQIDPWNAAAYNGVGITWAAQERFDEAIAAFRSALDHNPTLVDAVNNLGIVFDRQGKTDEAIAAFTKAVGLAPDQADIRVNLAGSLRGAGRLPEAVAEYERALRLDPASANAHYQFGVALTQSGRNDDAIAQYEQALRLDPQHADAHNDLGVTLVSLGRVREAISHFERALALNPGLADAQVNIEIAREMAGKAAQ